MKFNNVKLVSGISGFEKPGNDFVALEIEGTFKHHKQAVPLVLAAPELLAALELAVNEVEHSLEDIGPRPEWVCIAMAAIKKAKGE